MYISCHVRFHEHVFLFDNFEQIAQVSAQNRTPPPTTILPNLTHSPLFTDHDRQTYPASASALHLPHSKTPQPPPFPCRSPYVSISHHSVAGTGRSVFPALQQDVSASAGTPSSSFSASLYFASHQAIADSVSAASPLLAAASPLASSPDLNLVVDLSAYPL